MNLVEFCGTTRIRDERHSSGSRIPRRCAIFHASLSEWTFHGFVDRGRVQVNVE